MFDQCCLLLQVVGTCDRLSRTGYSSKRQEIEKLLENSIGTLFLLIDGVPC